MQHKAEKLELRRKKMLNSKAILIQKVFRGYRVRRLVKKLHHAAIMIQKVVRGYLVRYEQHAAMERIVNEEEKRKSTEISSERKSVDDE